MTHIILAVITAAIVVEISIWIFTATKRPVRMAALQRVKQRIEEEEKAFADFIRREKRLLAVEIRKLRNQLRHDKAGALQEHVEKVLKG